MTFNIHDLRQLEQQIKTIAEDFLMPFYLKVKKSTKKDGSLVSEADYEVQNRIQTLLKDKYPDIPLLGEEMSKVEQLDILNNQSSFWCLDPVDGTSNFLSGIPCFSISLALFCDGEVIAGIVYDPERDESFSALKAEGAWLNTERLQLKTTETSLSSLMAIVDFKKMNPVLANNLVKNPPYASQRSFGSVALDWCWLAAGRCQVYLHSRHTVWDFAAGLLIFNEAGGVASNFDGEELNHFILDKQVAIAATSIELFAKWSNWLEGHCSEVS